jgi:hypothetical protein
MKTISWNERPNVKQTNFLKERITLLSEKGFLWREIAELTDLPKKLIKGIAKGEYLATDEECVRLCGVIDKTIERLRSTVDANSMNGCPELEIDAEDYEFIKLDVKSVTIFKGTDDDKMIVQIHGVKFHD